MTNKENFVSAEATEVVHCPVCESNHYKILYSASDYEYELPGVFYVSSCEDCGLILQQPRPQFQDILRYYTEKYEPFRSVGSPLMQKIRYWFLVRPRVEKYKKLVSHLDRPADLLDVGCGPGDLLAELSLEKFFICQGVEPVLLAAEMAWKRGLKVHQTTLENFESLEESFDMIIMNHVLEHLSNPKEVTEKAYKLLRSGGVFVGETPSAQSIELAIFRRYWAMFHLPRHLFFFSPALIKRFLKRLGFRKIEVRLQPTPSCWQASVRNLLHSFNAPKQIAKPFSGHSFIINALSFPLAYIVSKIGYAPIMHFTAYK